LALVLAAAFEGDHGEAAAAGGEAWSADHAAPGDDDDCARARRDGTDTAGAGRPWDAVHAGTPRGAYTRSGFTCARQVVESAVALDRALKYHARVE